MLGKVNVYFYDKNDKEQIFKEGTFIEVENEERFNKLVSEKLVTKVNKIPEGIKVKKLTEPKLDNENKNLAGSEELESDFENVSTEKLVVDEIKEEGKKISRKRK